MRIGLHAGPVFEGIDAITGRPNFFGSRVNRAARIEPVTLPGHIYASQQFVGAAHRPSSAQAANQISVVADDPIETIFLENICFTFCIQKCTVHQQFGWDLV